MKIAAIVQARTASTRFPNKVFAPLCDKPLIWHIFDRISYSKKITHSVLATTINKADDVLIDWSAKEGIGHFRGSEEDVLSRYYYTALEQEADIIVRVTSDDPFKDPAVIDDVINMFIDQQLDFACNNNPPSFPEGLDIEVFSFKALECAYQNAKDPSEREHVTQFFYRNPSLFKQANMSYRENISHLRWTLDTEADYAMAKEVYHHLYKPGKIFLFQDILQLLRSHPEIALMNKDVKRSTLYS